jgi:hypothetical protein
VRQACLVRELRCSGSKLSLPRRIDEVARQHHALPLPARQSFAGEVINAALHSVSHHRTEPAAS